MPMLDKTTTVNLLFDYYHPLLKEKQRNFLEMYYHDDLSLGEIAEIKNITRQAVYDQIKRTEKILYDLENKLQLLSKDQKRQQLITSLQNMMETFQVNNSEDRMIEEMKRILEQLKSMDD